MSARMEALVPCAVVSQQKYLVPNAEARAMAKHLDDLWLSNTHQRDGFSDKGRIKRISDHYS